MQAENRTMLHADVAATTTQRQAVGLIPGSTKGNAPECCLCCLF
jgi:hypothetical protein